MLSLAGSPAPLLAGTNLTFSALTSHGSFGEVPVRGQATITVKDLNWVRYRYRIGRHVTEIDAPNVLKLLPSLTSNAANKNQAEPTNVPPTNTPNLLKLLPFTPDVVLAQIPSRIKCGDVSLVTMILQTATQADSAQRATAERVRKLRAFIADSGRLASDTLMARCRRLIEETRNTKNIPIWPGTDALKNRLASLKERIFLASKATLDSALSRTEAELAQATVAPRVDGKLKKVEKALALVEAAELDGKLRQTEAALARVEKTNLDSIVRRIEAVKPKWLRAEQQIAEIAEHLRTALQIHERTQSKITESINIGPRPRKENLTLLVFDLFPPDEADTAQTKKAKVEELPLVTFVCEHPLSFSFGVFMSRIIDKEYDFRPMLDAQGNIKTSEVIGFNNRSKYRAIPGVLVNMLLPWHCSDHFDMHLSLGGALANLGGEHGSNVEYIVGGSVRIKRCLLVTVGVHVGRVTTLQENLTQGIQKIEGLDTVPTQKHFKSGIGVGISYSFVPK